MSQLNWEEKYRRLEANIPGMVYRFAMHPDGTFSFPYANDASRKLFNLGPEELMADASLITGLIHPDDRATFDASVLRSAMTLEPWRQELRHIVDGEVRWYDCISRPERQANGDIVWDGIILEITERKRAEDALRESEHRYREVFENSSECIFLLDLTADGRFKFAGFNPAEEKAVGFLSAETSGRFVEEVTPRGLSCQVVANYRRCVQSGTIQHYEEKLHLPVGTRYFQTVLIPVRNAVGDIYRIIGIARDTTESRRVEEALWQASLVVENSPVVLFRWRAAEGWPVVMVSKNVTRFGYAPEELLSGAIPFTSIVHPRDLQRVSAEVRGYVARGIDQFQQEYRIVTKQGETRWIDDRTVVERDAAGKINHYQGIVMDITDRKRTENVMEARLRLLQFAETHSFDELLEATLNEAEAVTESLIGFYVFVQRDQTTVSLQNWSTRTKREYCRAEGKGLHYDLSQAGVWTDCIHQRRPVIHNDYASLPHRKGLPPGHASLIRELLVPVFRGKNIVAVLAVGNKSTDYTARDVETVSLLADLAWSIVERKNSQEALKESEEKFRVLAETAPTAIVVYQGEKIVYVNSAAGRLFGYGEAELMEMNFWDWATEDSREFVRERGLARQRGEQVPNQYEYRFKNGKGEAGWALVSAGTIEYRGKPGGIAAFIDITETKRAEERLQASLAEKEVLLKEVHHRVKNNLQIISSLLYLQSESIPDEQSRGYLRESQNRVQSMALIHERLYGSKNFSAIDFGDYMRELSSCLFDSYAVDAGRISLNVSGAGGSLGINEAIPCGLIVNELLSNALKHAFPGDRSGEISIRMGKDGDGRITLTVADTGIGLPPGLDFGNTETLGLQLVNTLVRQLRGRLTVGGEGGGTAVSIAFPGNGHASSEG